MQGVAKSGDGSDERGGGACCRSAARADRQGVQRRQDEGGEGAPRRQLAIGGYRVVVLTLCRSTRMMVSFPLKSICVHINTTPPTAFV